MEHIVKRKSDFLINPYDLRKLSTGETRIFVQSKVGSPYFKLKPNGSPEKVKSGDIIWFMRSGYGVFAKGIVSFVDKAIKIESQDKLDEFRKNFRLDFRLQSKYWNEQNAKLKKAKSQKTALFFNYVEYEIVDLLEHFPIPHKKGHARSWIYIDDSNRDSYFKWRGKKSCEELILEEGKNYGNITIKVKEDVRKLWKNTRIDGKSFEFGVHLDHLIPQSLGGAGFFVENIVPDEPELNIRKSNSIRKSVAKVIHTYFPDILNRDLLESWDSSLSTIKSNQNRIQQGVAEAALKRIKTEAIRKQQIFYLDILEQEFPETNFREKYKEAGMNYPRDDA